MSNGKLEEFKAYLQALELFDHVVGDMARYMQSSRLKRLAGQQLASVDSVYANIEEGYGRESTAEYRRFLIIARGSLRETRGRYRRMRHWIHNPDEPEKQLFVAGCWLLVNGQRIRRMRADTKDEQLLNFKKRKCLFTNNQQPVTSNFLPKKQEDYK